MLIRVDYVNLFRKEKFNIRWNKWLRKEIVM